MKTFYRLMNHMPVFLLSGIGLSILLILTLLSSDNLPEVPAFPMIDKVEHFLAFGCVALALMFDFGRRLGHISAKMLLWVACFMTALGFLIEYLQGTMGQGRSADFLDAVADCLGSVVLPAACWDMIRKCVSLYVVDIRPSGFGSVELSRIKRLYVNSFPESERRPWDDLVSRASDSCARLNLAVISHKNHFAGMLTWWRLDDALRYVEHFAVEPSLRGSGIGAGAISGFVAMEETPVILEVEPADLDDMARRRIRFYSRCGFVAHPGFSYVQPPYSDGLPAVDLMLMTAGRSVDLSDATARIHQMVYGVGNCQSVE